MSSSNSQTPLGENAYSPGSPVSDYDSDWNNNDQKLKQSGFGVSCMSPNYTSFQ